MSLDLINHKLTTSTTDKNGVIWWSNPAVLVKINSKGEVYDNDRIDRNHRIGLIPYNFIQLLHEGL